MIGRGRGAQCRHRVGDAVLEQRDHVHVAFDHDQSFDFAVRLPHLPKPVQLATLVEQWSLRRVEIFGRIFRIQDPPAERDGAAAAIQDRKHHPVAEFVVDVAFIVLREQTDAFQQRHPARIGAQRIAQRRKTVRRIAQTELGADRVVHAAAVEVAARFVAGCELLLKKLRRRFQRRVLIDAVRGRVALLGIARHFHTDALGEFVHRIEKFEAVVVHQEADRSAVRAAAEAVVELLGGRHRERPRAFVVERATRRVFLALALQRHARGDQLHDIGACQQVVDECVGDAGHVSCGSVVRAGGSEDRDEHRISLPRRHAWFRPCR